MLAATATAFLPMGRQVVPGLVLLVLAPVMIVWVGVDFGVWVALAAVFAFVSMFRKPLFYFYRRARGENPERPR